MKTKESVYESLTIACLHAVRRSYWAEPLNHGDDTALNRVAPLTHEISNVHGASSATVRKHLRQLLAEGRVICSSHPGWTSRWWPKGFADALEAAKVTIDGRSYYEMPATQLEEAA